MSSDIRILGKDQIETLVEWAEAEGWNPGLDDARRFQQADPNGFLGAFVDGRLVAGISVVAYDDRFGFLGLYICHPDFRGQGFGRAVWDKGMAYLGTRTIGLDGVPEQQTNYRRMGFSTQYETVRMGGVLARSAAKTCQVSVLREVEDVLDFDRACFPARRDTFLSAWLSPPHLGYVAKRDGAVCGYIVVRDCRSGQKIGPLFAVDIDAALDLLAMAEGAIQVDVPAHQRAALDHLGRMGFEPQFRTARMYRGHAPAIDLDRVFGVTTLELG